MAGINVQDKVAGINENVFIDIRIKVNLVSLDCSFKFLPGLVLSVSPFATITGFSDLEGFSLKSN